MRRPYLTRQRAGLSPAVRVRGRTIARGLRIRNLSFSGGPSRRDRSVGGARVHQGEASRAPREDRPRDREASLNPQPHVDSIPSTLAPFSGGTQNGAQRSWVAIPLEPRTSSTVRFESGGDPRDPLRPAPPRDADADRQEPMSELRWYGQAALAGVAIAFVMFVANPSSPLTYVLAIGFFVAALVLLLRREG